MPLEPKYKKYEKKPQTNAPKEFTPDIIKKMNLLKEKIISKKGQTFEEKP
jgi:hypothetical protein